MLIVIKKTDSIKEIRRKMKAFEFQKSGKLFNAKKFNGAIKFEGDALEIQKKMRKEWKKNPQL